MASIHFSQLCAAMGRNTEKITLRFTAPTGLRMKQSQTRIWLIFSKRANVRALSRNPKFLYFKHAGMLQFAILF